MSGQRKLILGNWKMHFTVKQAANFAGKLAGKAIPEGVTVGVAPHALALSEVSALLQKTGLKVVAQNAYFQDEGAYTGEVSMPMLRGLAQYVLIGHSERRHIFYEPNEMTKNKVASALRSGIIPVLCVGETLVERRHHHTNQILSDQLTFGLANITADEVARCVIAYEPVWAIGTGEFASPDDVARATHRIRHEIEYIYGEEAARQVTILYGGSVSKENATSYLQLDDVDGLLIGGASLMVSTFWPIVELASKSIAKKIEIKDGVK